MNDQYYFTRALGDQSETIYFDHFYQQYATILDWRYSLPGYFSDRPIKIPDGESVAYGIKPKPQSPVKVIPEQFSPSKDSFVRSNTVPAGSLVKIKCAHRNSDLFMVKGQCLRADAGTEIPAGMYYVLGMDFKTGQGELMIVKETVP